jgi:hypothetical protein
VLGIICAGIRLFFCCEQAFNKEVLYFSSKKIGRSGNKTNGKFSDGAHRRFDAPASFGRDVWNIQVDEFY